MSDRHQLRKLVSPNNGLSYTVWEDTKTGETISQDAAFALLNEKDKQLAEANARIANFETFLAMFDEAAAAADDLAKPLTEVERLMRVARDYRKTLEQQNNERRIN